MSVADPLAEDLPGRRAASKGIPEVGQPLLDPIQPGAQRDEIDRLPGSRGGGRRRRAITVRACGPRRTPSTRARPTRERRAPPPRPRLRDRHHGRSRRAPGGSSPAEIQQRSLETCPSHRARPRRPGKAGTARVRPLAEAHEDRLKTVLAGRGRGHGSSSRVCDPGKPSKSTTRASGRQERIRGDPRAAPRRQRRRSVGRVASVGRSSLPALPPGRRCRRPDRPRRSGSPYHADASPRRGRPRRATGGGGRRADPPAQPDRSL